jgi:hypothetical protein
MRSAATRGDNQKLALLRFEVGIGGEVRAEEDLLTIGTPGRIVLVEFSEGNLTRPAAFYLERPDVGKFLLDESAAV